MSQITKSFIVFVPNLVKRQSGEENGKIGEQKVLEISKIPILIFIICCYFCKFAQIISMELRRSAVRGWYRFFAHSHIITFPLFQH